MGNLFIKTTKLTKWAALTHIPKQPPHSTQRLPTRCLLETLTTTNTERTTLMSWILEQVPLSSFSTFSKSMDKFTSKILELLNLSDDPVCLISRLFKQNCYFRFTISRQMGILNIFLIKDTSHFF